jgi:hypothetical protein
MSSALPVARASRPAPASGARLWKLAILKGAVPSASGRPWDLSRSSGRASAPVTRASRPALASGARLFLFLLLFTLPLFPATRPRYGGTLRLELRQAYEVPDPPPLIESGFIITRWEAGRRALYDADESTPGGRPFLDSIEIILNRPLRDQSIDLELNKADVVELGPNELRRQPAGRRLWTSSPVRILTLVFSPRIEDARVREALALSVDRSAIHSVLLQRQGEISAALLPQWLSGYAFVFPAAPDLARARTLSGGARPLTLGVEEQTLRPIAERIALNARDAGLTVTVTTQPGADLRLEELSIVSTDPARALAALATSLGAPAPPPADSAEALLAAERALLEGYRAIPLIHLPEVYGVAPRVKGPQGITPLGEWRLEDVWLEGTRP